MHTKSKVIKITPKNSIQQRCGECLHFKNGAYFEKPCSQLGIKRFAAAPVACYSPDVYALATKVPDALFQIGILFHDFSVSESRILMSLLNQNKTFDKSYGLKFGQPVYFCLGSDYLANYFRGYVVGAATAGDQRVYVTSDMSGRQRKKPVIATLMRESVYSVSEFKKKRAWLEAQSRLNDPTPAVKPIVKKIDTNYEVPSMESAPADWYDNFGARLNSTSSKKKAKRGKNGLSYKLSL